MTIANGADDGWLKAAAWTTALLASCRKGQTRIGSSEAGIEWVADVLSFLGQSIKVSKHTTVFCSLLMVLVQRRCLKCYASLNLKE